MDGLGTNPGIKVLVIKDSFKRVVTIPKRTLQSLRAGITKEFDIPNNESVGITRTVFYVFFFAVMPLTSFFSRIESFTSNKCGYVPFIIRTLLCVFGFDHV